jgi:transposase
MARDRRKFDPEFKAEAVGLVKAGRGVSAVARELNLTPSALTRWVQQSRVDAGEGPPTGELTTAEREELRRLRRENRILHMEKEILKKATAFFAKENK